jgi:uncharacterized membrane protein
MDRFWEIDFLRGIAIIMMIIYHIIFDLTFFGNYNTLVFSNIWYWFGRLTAVLFILLVGVSLTLSYSRTKKKKKVNWSKYLKRGLKIFSIGLFISLVTYLIFPKYYIVFGILHFIGLSIIIGYFFIRFKFSNLILGVLFILSGIYLSKLTFNFYWLLWIGLTPINFQAFDYYPLFPYFGIVLIGIFLGNFLYPNYKRKFNIPELPTIYTKTICSLGRKSLIIYLIHQPIILIILFSLGLIYLHNFIFFG